MSTETVTNTPRAGETAGQAAARLAPRMPPAPRAKLAFLSQPSPGVFLLNLQYEDGEDRRVEISRAQLRNILIDGTVMAFRENAANGDFETIAAFVGGS